MNAAGRNLLVRALVAMLAFLPCQIGAYSASFVPKSKVRSSSFVPSTVSQRLSMMSSFPSSNHLLPSSRRSGLPSQYRTTTTAASAATAATSWTMLVESSGGMEELTEMAEAADAQQRLWAKQVRKSPTLFRWVSRASIPVSAALGFGLVPARGRLVANGIGAVLSGLAGAVGKSRMDSFLSDLNHVKPAVAEALVDVGIDDVAVAQAAVQKIRQNFGIVDDDDWQVLCTEIYASYLVGMVKYNAFAKTSEIRELQTVQSILELENLALGEAHHQAAQMWSRQVSLTASAEEWQATMWDDDDEDDDTSPEFVSARQSVDKFLFLSERAFRSNNETPDQAFLFEMTRIAKAFELTYQQSLERVAATAEPFYKRALKSTRAKLGLAAAADSSSQISSSMLDRARKTLGIAVETTADLHVTCFNEHVKELLSAAETEGGTASGELKFRNGAAEELEELREILGLSAVDANYEIMAEATPLYQATTLAALEKVIAQSLSPEDAWEIMEERREELLLTEDSSKDLLKSIIMQALGAPLERTNKFAKVNNEAATYDNLLEALEAKEVLLSILRKSGWGSEFNESFDATFCNPWDKQSANGFLLSDERIKLYRIFLTRTLRKAPEAKMSDEMYSQVKEVQGLLGITEMQAEIEARGAFGPFLQKVLDTAMTEIAADYTPELASNMQTKIEEIMENYRLSNDFLRELGATYYAKAVALISEKSPSGIPTKEQEEALESLRSLYQLEAQDTYSSHMEYFGQVYKKSVLEAMGTTGVIRPEFREGLSDLQSRLGVSGEDCKKLFLEAIGEKMVPMAKWVGSEMERTVLSQKQLAQRRGKDLGEDVFQTGKGADGVLGLGAEVNIMSDIMELVDFYRENEVAYEDDDGETIYPLTALGTGAIDQELAELLYRQFIVGGFQAQGEKATRYEEARDTFAGILGLEKFKLDEIKDTIGSTVFDNLVTNSIKTKGSMDQQDMMMIANVQTKLGMSEEQGEKLVLQAQKKVLSEEINYLMDNPSPEGIKTFREKCNGLGMDLSEDVGISKQRLTRMFESEIAPGLQSGEITVEENAILAEIQDSLGLEASECESMFESLLMRLANSAMEVMTGELMRGREANCVDLVKEIVRYANFNGGDLGLGVEEATAYQVLNIFEALDFSDEDPEQVKSDTELLRVALGLP